GLCTAAALKPSSRVSPFAQASGLYRQSLLGCARFGCTFVLVQSATCPVTSESTETGRPKPRSGSCGIRNATSPTQKIARKIIFPSLVSSGEIWATRLCSTLKAIGKLQCSLVNARASRHQPQRGLAGIDPD